MDFKSHLRKQLGFLQRSCAAYDDGHADEAIRIATVIRVLIHNTSNSTSLLQHLNATNIALRSTPGEPPSPQVVMYFGLGLFAMGNGASSYRPQLGDGPPISRLVPTAEWWDEVVYVIDPTTRLRRRDIVLAAANKDGGAHVDSKLTPLYEALSRDGALGSFGYSAPDGNYTQPISDAHLVALRQMGWELLNSPDLLGLAA